jgi:hypothetical protein
MLARNVDKATLLAHQNDSVSQKPDPDPVSVGALSGATQMETLKVEIVDCDGKVVRVIEIADPREIFVKVFNECGEKIGTTARAA